MANKNIPAPTLLNAIASLLEEFPALHEQTQWETTPSENECGTKACIAGWAVILGTDDFKQKDLKITKSDGTTVTGHFWLPKMRTVREHSHRPDMPKMSHDDRITHLAGRGYYEEKGRELLELNFDDAALLFHENGQPRDDMTVSEALRAIAAGVAVREVWTDGYEDDDEDYE